ncbi:MAG TPA: hypothetical protein VF043_18060 [Ktedonobacteraceae bacterium]
MSSNPNQGQDPNSPGEYSQPGNISQPDSYQQPGGYSQQDSYQQPGGYSAGGCQQQFGPYGTPGAPAAAIRPNPHGPTSMGLDANVAAGLSYLLSLVGGLIFYFGEKYNHFVRFSAMQSIIFSVSTIALVFVLFILQVIFTATIFLSPLAFALFCLTFLLIFAGAAVHLILAVFAFQGKTMRLPVIANYADKYVSRTV